MKDYPEIFVLRHGQTEWNAEGRHQGQLDSPLTALGRRQAADQGRILVRSVCDPVGISCYASPQGRAWNTAGIALAAIGRAPLADDRLKEVSFGLWEGLTGDEICANWPGDQEITDPFHWHFTSLGGERLGDLRVRAQSFLDDLAGPTIIVTHGILSRVLRVLRGLYLGLDTAGMAAIEGGQGMVYHLEDGTQTGQNPPSEPPEPHGT